MHCLLKFSIPVEKGIVAIIGIDLMDVPNASRGRAVVSGLRCPRRVAPGHQP